MARLILLDLKKEIGHLRIRAAPAAQILKDLRQIRIHETALHQCNQPLLRELERQCRIDEFLICIDRA